MFTYGLGVPSKNENFKKDSFFLVTVLSLDYSKGKICFLTKIMLLNEIQTFFVFQVKLDNISLLFKFNLTSH